MFSSHFHTYVAGIKHHKTNFYNLDLSQREHKLELIPEPTNKHDPNAIKVIVDGKHIGYVPANKCAKVHKILTKRITEQCFICEEDDGEYINDIHIWYK